MPLFIITTYQGNVHLTKKLLTQLNLRYPSSVKVVIYDGEVDEEVEGATHIIHGKKISSGHFGQLWLKRWLSTAFVYCDRKNPDSVIVKLDPDVHLTRQFKSIPDADVFGSIGHSDLFGKSVQCGAFGIRVSAVQEILVSKILDDVSLPIYEYSRYEKFKHESEKSDSTRMQHEDTYLALCIHKLGLAVEDWSEVNCKFRPIYKPEEIDSSAAFWHPVI